MGLLANDLINTIDKIFKLTHTKVKWVMTKIL